MYCKKCGCKLKTGNNICPECGADSTDIEYCGGFWGIVDLSKQIDAEPSASSAGANQRTVVVPEISISADAPSEQTADIKDNRFPLLAKLILALALVLFVICVIQTLRLSNVSKNLTVQDQRYEELNQEYEELKKQYEDLEQEYAAPLVEEGADNYE